MNPLEIGVAYSIIRVGPFLPLKKLLDLRLKDNQKSKKYKREWYKKNKQRILEKRKEYFHENKLKIYEYQKSWREDNKDKIIEYHKKFYSENLEYCKEYTKNYMKNNKLRYRILNAKHRAIKRDAIPKWLSKEQLEDIRNIYDLAYDCRVLTGDQYHVDHIVPLKGKNVCGLHVPWNLQVLPADINKRKSNVYKENIING